MRIVKSIKSKNEDFYINPNFWLVAYEPDIFNLLKSEVYLNSQKSLKNAMTLKNQLLGG
jgi:hypothetical protein